MSRFQVVEENPNDVTGGGGCLCFPEKNVDQSGPYIVFTATEMEDVRSPQPVLCHNCACQVSELVQDEPEPVDAEVVEDTEDEVPRV